MGRVNWEEREGDLGTGNFLFLFFLGVEGGLEVFCRLHFPAFLFFETCLYIVKGE